MPRLVDQPDRFQDLLDVAVDLLADGGLPRLSMRTIADGLRVRASVVQHYYGTKSRILGLVTFHLWRRRRRLMTLRRPEGVSALLPRTDDELRTMNAWLAMLEVARYDASVAHQLAARDDEERIVVDRLLDVDTGSERRHSQALVDVVSATALGLAHRRCAAEPMSAEDAERALRAVVEALAPVLDPDEPESAA